MAILGGVPVLSCRNIERAIVFYQQALQFVVVNQRRDDNGVQWAHLQHADTSLMLEAAPDKMAQQAGCSRLYLFCDDVDALHHYLGAKGYTVGDIRETDYFLREFNLADTEGHRLTLGQVIKR